MVLPNCDSPVVLLSADEVPRSKIRSLVVAPDDLIKGCLASLLASSSSSDLTPSSKVSARVLSTLFESKGARLRWRDAGDEARDRKDGGGDEDDDGRLSSSSGVADGSG